MNEQLIVIEPSPPRILVLDLETSGLDAERHGILDVGARWLLNGDGEFNRPVRLRAGAEWDMEAQNVHGITYEKAISEDRPREEDVIDEFLQWTGPGPVILAGLNPAIDRAFVRAAMNRMGVRGFGYLFPHRIIDLHTLAISYALAKGEPIPERGFWTDHIYALLGMPEEPKPHKAINGARMEHEALRVLLCLPAYDAPVPYELAEGVGS